MERPRAYEIAADPGTGHARKITLYQLTLSHVLSQSFERALFLDSRAMQCAVPVFL